MNRTNSLKQAYSHGREARKEGKPRISSYQNPTWEREWLNGYDAEHVYIASGSGITGSRAATEGGYSYHAGRPNTAPAHWSKPLRSHWHRGWEAARSTHEANTSCWAAPAPPWEDNPFGKAREDLVKLGMEVPHFMERNSILYSKPCPILLYDSPCKGKFRRDKDRAYTGLTAMPLNKELNAMNSTLAFVFASLLPDVVSVKVVFTSGGEWGKAYTYKALKSQGIVVGDFVIVDSPNGGPTMVKVTAVGTFEDLDAGAYQGYKWIVGKVDIADYAATTEKEKSFYQKVEELQRKAKAQKALEALAESLGGMDALKALMGELTPAPADPTKAQGSEVQGTPPPTAA